MELLRFWELSNIVKFVLLSCWAKHRMLNLDKKWGVVGKRIKMISVKEQQIKQLEKVKKMFNKSTPSQKKTITKNSTI